MTASGVDSVCAEATAEMLVDAEVTGMSTHGVSRLSIYMERIQAGIMSPNNNIRIVQEAPSALTVDAGNSLGAAAAKFTMTKCIEKPERRAFALPPCATQTTSAPRPSTPRWRLRPE